MTDNNYLEKAAEDLPFKPIYEFDGKEIHVICLLSKSPPLTAHWWKGKQVHLLGVDVDGNFFLSHCDGSVRYWRHSEQSEIVVAKSERDFVRGLREDINNTLEWWRGRDDSSDA